MTVLLIYIQRYWQAITLLILTVITALSLWPLETLPAVPGTDKTHHFIAYATLIFPVALRKPRYWLMIGGFFIAWSGAIELVQPYVNRYGEWLDMAANTGGIVCGILAALLIRARRLV
ncbi:MAG: VanZ family protein [Desulfuromonas sp.]|nr:VanZ family protein [Desulfuromonas sp.]